MIVSQLHINIHITVTLYQKHLNRLKLSMVKIR